MSLRCYKANCSVIKLWIIVSFRVLRYQNENDLNHYIIILRSSTSISTRHSKPIIDYRALSVPDAILLPHTKSLSSWRLVLAVRSHQVTRPYN